MDLEPVIASYSGQAYRAIKVFLDARTLGLIAEAAQCLRQADELDDRTRDELIEMHVLRSEDGQVRLDTSVFLEDDIQRIGALVSQLSGELAAPVIEGAAEMRGEPPAVTNLVVGILGIGQSLGHALRDAGVAVDWKRYGGRYASSKVDFHQVCDAHAALGVDLQNKTVLRGRRYTAVFVGPGGPTYQVAAEAAELSGESAYAGHLNRYLTDAFAMLLNGELDHPDLRAAGEQVGLLEHGEPATVVLTHKMMERYLPAVQRVGGIVHEYLAARLGTICDLLRSTRCGRQGVPLENMMMNLWRYLRRGIARELYARGLFADKVPGKGVITLFYANDLEALRELLG